MIATVLGNMFVNAMPMPMPIQVFLNVLAMCVSSFYLNINGIVHIFQAGGSTTSSWLVKGMRVATRVKLLKDTHCTTSRACFVFFGACILVMAFQHPTHTLF